MYLQMFSSLLRSPRFEAGLLTWHLVLPQDVGITSGFWIQSPSCRLKMKQWTYPNFEGSLNTSLKKKMVPKNGLILRKIPQGVQKRGAKTLLNKMCPKKHHPSFTPILPDPIMLEMIFPTPKEKKCRRFLSELRFFNLKILYLVTEFVMDFRSRSLEKLDGEAIHPFTKSEWWRPFSDFQVVFLSNLYLQNFVSKLWGLQKSPKVSSNTTCLGDLGWGRSFFCRPWQIWFFLQQLCRLCTQQNTKGTEWESPSCRPVSHNSTRTSGSMQKSFGC